LPDKVGKKGDLSKKKWEGKNRNKKDQLILGIKGNKKYGNPEREWRDRGWGGGGQKT